MMTMTLADPTGYGRVVRDASGAVERVVETKRPGDATPEEMAIPEVNAGVYAFYLPAALGLLRAGGAHVAAHSVEDPSVLLGVNDRVELATARAIAQQRIREAHMLAGVTLIDPASTVIDVDVRIGADTVIEPSTFLRGATAVGERATVGPLTTVIDSTLGDDATVVHSYLHGAEVRAGATVGPFAYLRPGALLREGAKAGTFVEIKNSDIGEGTKVPHLSYVGDTDVGPGTNLGAATITANYDGRRKHRTTIGAGVRTSVDTTLVAPVTVGDRAYTAAGSVITEDVPPGALGVARARQTNIEGYADRRAAGEQQSS
jgi:bifunctional UDP-N-acetylglucosamine pyrophosphorylase/glucosamine-1-phosphate N-acetyltransferase